MDIAVVDAGGNLKAHARMDGANIGSIPISINKAYTAIAFQSETGDVQDTTRSDGPIYGLNDAHGGRLVVFPGGILLVRDRKMLGAIGVSRGTIEQDQKVAEAGVEAGAGLLRGFIVILPAASQLTRNSSRFERGSRAPAPSTTGTYPGHLYVGAYECLHGRVPCERWHHVFDPRLPLWQRVSCPESRVPRRPRPA